MSIRRLFCCFSVLCICFINIYYAHGAGLSGKIYISPVDFGANGSDNIDDSDAFQKSIEVSKKLNNSLIFIPPGRYLIGKEISIDEVNNLTIEGNGAILEKPSGSPSNVFYGNYNRQITIRNIIFMGNRSPNFKEKWPHHMNACAILGRSSGIRFENCVVKDFYYGICLGTSSENGYDVWVINCQFDNNNSDIDLYGKPLVCIKGNVSHNCTGHSIQIEPPYKRETKTFNYLEQETIEALSVGNIISENVIENCQGIGVILFGGSENISISNNQIINYGTAGILTHSGSANILICGNIISNSINSQKNERPWKDRGAGIILTRVNNAIVNSNIISHANSGIYVSGSHGAIISNNKISNSKDSGICLYDATNCLLNGNFIENYNLDRSWWANSGVVVFKSEDINILGASISDENSNYYSIYVGNSRSISINNVMGHGFSESLSNVEDNHR